MVADCVVGDIEELMPAEHPAEVAVDIVEFAAVDKYWAAKALADRLGTSSVVQVLVALRQLAEVGEAQR